MNINSEESDRIRRILRTHPRGLSITDISRKLQMNRNSVAKYLEVLQMAGDSEMRKVCTAKLYFPSRRIPITEMLSLSRDLIVVLDSDNTIIEINEPFLTLTGATRDEIVGHDADDTQLFIFNNPEIMEMLLSEDEAGDFSREIIHNHDDKEYTFRLKLIPTNLSNGNHGTIITVEDVTDKRRFERKIEEREAFYRSVIEDQTEYIVRYDPDMIITFANEPFCKLVGKTMDKLVGTKKYLPVPKAYRRRVQRHFEILLPEHSVGVLENPLINAEGETIWCEWTNRAFYKGKKIVGYQSVGRDITDRIRLEQAQKEIAREFTFLSGFMMGLLEIKPEDNIYDYVGEMLGNIVHNAIIIVTSYHENQAKIETVNAGKQCQKTTLYRNLKVYENSFFKWDASGPPESTSEMGTLNHVDIASILSYMNDNKLQNVLKKLDHSADIYFTSIMSEGTDFGSILFITPQGKQVSNERAIYLALYQMESAIQRRIYGKSLITTEERHKALINNEKLMMVIHIEGIIVYANPTAIQFFCTKENEDYRGKYIMDYVHPDYQNIVKERVHETSTLLHSCEAIIEKMIRGDGTVAEVEVMTSPTQYKGKTASLVIIREVRQ